VQVQTYPEWERKTSVRCPELLLLSPSPIVLFWLDVVASLITFLWVDALSPIALLWLDITGGVSKLTDGVLPWANVWTGGELVGANI